MGPLSPHLWRHFDDIDLLLLALGKHQLLVGGKDVGACRSISARLQNDHDLAVGQGLEDVLDLRRRSKGETTTEQALNMTSSECWGQTYLATSIFTGPHL